MWTCITGNTNPMVASFRMAFAKIYRWNWYYDHLIVLFITRDGSTCVESTAPLGYGLSATLCHLTLLLIESLLGSRFVATDACPHPEAGTDR